MGISLAAPMCKQTVCVPLSSCSVHIIPFGKRDGSVDVTKIHITYSSEQSKTELDTFCPWPNFPSHIVKRYGGRQAVSHTEDRVRPLRSIPRCIPSSSRENDNAATHIGPVLIVDRLLTGLASVPEPPGNIVTFKYFK